MLNIAFAMLNRYRKSYFRCLGGRFVVLVMAALTGIVPASGQITVVSLFTEGMKQPLGVGNARPQFSWMLQSPNRNARQTHFEIEMREQIAGKKNRVVWRSGRVASDQSAGIRYGGEPLATNAFYTWKVRVWDTAGKVSAWSSPAAFHTGLFTAAEWKAEWIAAGFAEDSLHRPSPLFRKEFRLNKPVARAILFITAQGMYEAHLNGKKIGDAQLTPGWTSYNKRLQYQAYEVTGYLEKGTNALAVVLGNGWYRSHLGWVSQHDLYGRELALLAQLEVEYTDGVRQTIPTDMSWKSSTGGIRSSEIYHGERIDLRRTQPGWDLPDFNEERWHSVFVRNFDKQRLVPTVNEPVREKEILKPKRIFRTPGGETVVDFGQNLVGWVRIKINGRAGDSVVLTHAEVLDKQGNMYYENLRSAQCRNVYISDGKGTNTFQPHFTWQGFRYVAVYGYPGTLSADQLEAVVLYSDMPSTGTFTTSNRLINQLQENIVWGQRGNFLDVPTDCPQRDERLGWTGDAQAFFRTAAFNYNVYPFFAKWLKDVEADQVNGAVPWVVPNVLNKEDVNSSGWSDVATIIPWNMYLAYGDTAILTQQYASMKAYVESIRRVAVNHLWNSGWHFGDWLFYRPADDNDGRAAVTDKFLIAQCFYAHSAELLAKAAAVLGNQQDAKDYSQLAANVRKAFQDEYLTPAGRLVSGTQTAYILALQFDMLPDALRQQAAVRLAENVKAYGHITTGFLGTPYINHVLTRFGYHDLAIQLLLRNKYPSWLYPVTMGATTIWERWDGLKPDSSFQTPGMNSFNHYAYGAIGDWLYRAVAGINEDEQNPGYKHIIIRPHPVKELGEVKASLQTRFGLVFTQWKPDAKQTEFIAEIPVNTTALFDIPAEKAGQVTEGGKPLSAVFGEGNFGERDGRVWVHAGSGYYRFTIAHH